MAEPTEDPKNETDAPAGDDPAVESTPPEAAAPETAAPAAATPEATAAPEAEGSLLAPLLVVLALAGVVFLVGRLVVQTDEDVQDTKAQVEALLEEGQKLATTQGVEAALRFFEQAYETAPESVEANVALGRAYAMLQQPEKALLLLNYALEQRPEEAQLHLLQGRCLVELGRFEQADAALRRSVELDPESEEAYGALVMSAFTQRDLEAIVARFPDYDAHTQRPQPMFLHIYASALEGLGRGAESLAQWERLARMQPWEVRLWRRVQDTRLDLEGYEAAVEEARLQAEAEPGPLTSYLLGRVLALSTPGRAEAKAVWEAAYAEETAFPWLQLGLGVERGRDGDTDGARALLLEALELDPGLVEARLALGDVERAAGRAEQARAQYEQVGQGPWWERAVRGQALSHCDTGQGEEALGFLAPLLEDTQKANPLWLVQAEVLRRLGRFDEAAAVIEGVVEALPAAIAPTRLGLLGLVKLEARDRAGARETFQAHVDWFTENGLEAPADALLWLGVLAEDPEVARRHWRVGADQERWGSMEFDTVCCARLLGEEGAETLQAVAVRAGWETRNDAWYVEALARELHGGDVQAALAAAAEATRTDEFPGRLCR